MHDSPCRPFCYDEVMTFWDRLLGQRDTTAEARFWTWFAKHAPELLRSDPRSAPVFRRLAKQLGQVREGLTWEIAAKGDPREFIISADGNRELFASVQRLVDAAPGYPGWTFIAFRPRSSADFVLEMDGVKLGPKDVWFSAERDGAVTHLTLYLPGLTGSNEDRLGRAAFILLDTLLGEHDVETKVGRIAWEALPPDPAAAGLGVLSNLPGVIDSAEGPTKPWS